MTGPSEVFISSGMLVIIEPLASIGAGHKKLLSWQNAGDVAQNGFLLSQITLPFIASRQKIDLLAIGTTAAGMVAPVINCEM